MGTGTIGLAATQINLFVNTQLATHQGTGAVSWLSYAFRLMYLPIGLFGVSIATAVLPQAARHAAANDVAAIRATVARGLALMIVVNVPAMCGLLALATPIVRVLFEHGRFLPSDTAPTAAALRFYAVGLVGYSAARIVSPVFYTVGRHRVPVAVSIASMAINVIASLVLVRLIGFRGLALGTSLAALANGALLLWLLRASLDGVNGRALTITLLKSLAGGAVTAAVAFGVEQWSSQLLGSASFPSEAACLLMAIGAGLGGLALCSRILHIAEFDEAFAMIRDRVTRL
jgi:putative peptidoglycan lipid II flippase